MVSKITQPSHVYFGKGAITKIHEIIEKEHVKKVLVITDEGLIEANLVSTLTDELNKNSDIEYTVFSDVKAEPSYMDAQKAVDFLNGKKVDMIIGIGGGSVMDIAKLCSVLKDSGHSVHDLLSDPACVVKKVKSVMIPSTCGTGSEATCNAIVAIPEENSKKGIVNEEMIPDYVILEARMIEKLPKQLIAATGVDALAHAVECATSKKATELSNTYALRACELIFPNIRKAYKDADDIEAKEKMQLGAYYGGVAITGSGTTAVHALSYPLGGRYHISHGVSNAILFAHVMEYNREYCKEDLARICDVVYPEYSEKSSDEKSSIVIRDIADIVKQTGIPTDLSGFNVTISDIDNLVDAGSKQTRLLVNNKRELNLEDIRNIYGKILV